MGCWLLREEEEGRSGAVPPEPEPMVRCAAGLELRMLGKFIETQTKSRGGAEMMT